MGAGWGIGKGLEIWAGQGVGVRRVMGKWHGVSVLGVAVAVGLRVYTIEAGVRAGKIRGRVWGKYRDGHGSRCRG